MKSKETLNIFNIKNVITKVTCKVVYIYNLSNCVLARKGVVANCRSQLFAMVLSYRRTNSLVMLMFRVIGTVTSFKRTTLPLQLLVPVDHWIGNNSIGCIIKARWSLSSELPLFLATIYSFRNTLPVSLLTLHSRVAANELLMKLVR